MSTIKRHEPVSKPETKPMTAEEMIESHTGIKKEWFTGNAFNNLVE